MFPYTKCIMFNRSCYVKLVSGSSLAQLSKAMEFSLGSFLRDFPLISLQEGVCLSYLKNNNEIK